MNTLLVVGVSNGEPIWVSRGSSFNYAKCAMSDGNVSMCPIMSYISNGAPWPHFAVGIALSHDAKSPTFFLPVGFFRIVDGGVRLAELPVRATLAEKPSSQVAREGHEAHPERFARLPR